MDCLGVTPGLTPDMIVNAYSRGIFPMGGEGRGMISWHCPARRAIIPLDRLHVSRSLRQRMKRGDYSITVNQAFASVMQRCADRPGGSWITAPILDAYQELHRRGRAHSLEVWLGAELAGGIYGVHLGGAFFAESKFHTVRDMSKVALASLVERLRSREFALLEVQYLTPHLARLGATEIGDAQYRQRLRTAIRLDRRFC